MVERRHAHVAPGVALTAVRQVELGVDQRAVEIENDKVHRNFHLTKPGTVSSITDFPGAEIA